MTATLDSTTTVLSAPSVHSLRPGYEGGNISTTIGFKHVHYLIEAAVLEHFRAADLGATALYLRHGVNFDVVAVDTRLHTVLTLDDSVSFEVNPVRKDGDTQIRFAVTGTVDRAGVPTKAVSSKVGVLLRIDPKVTDATPLPAELAPFAVAALATSEPTALAATPVDNINLALGRGVHSADDPVLAEIIGDTNAFGWKWRIPYFYCHFTNHVQMSGFLRQMEEVLHLFVGARGIGIKKLLDERGWIPVVTQCKLQLTDETIMEEELYTVFTIEKVFKEILFTARMDTYVVREGALVKTSTGVITHGYVSKESPDKEWQLSVFDEPVLRALNGK